MTPSLRSQLDHVGALMGGGSTADIDTVRFALAFTSALVPQPLLPNDDDVEGILDMIRQDLISLRVYDETYPIGVRANDLEAITRRRR